MNIYSFDYHWLDSLHHTVTDDYLLAEETVNHVFIQLKVKVLKNNDLKGLTLFWLQDGDEIKQSLIKKSTLDYDIWKGEFSIAKTTDDKLFAYRFIVYTDNHTFFWDAAGFYKYSVTTVNNFKYYYGTQQPQWLETAVMYHIFIDRFHKSSAATHQNTLWGGKLSNAIDQFFGGDLKGIEDKLNYLVKLGVNTLCLTPIFESPSNHKYDTQDYYNIASCFGGNKEFVQFMAACKKVSIRVILDGVFNHVGEQSKWFNKASLYKNIGAYQSTDSSYSDYFYFEQHPDNYAMFWQEKHLPKLNYQSQKLRNEIYQNKNSIVRHWLKGTNKIDGWRLDACCMLGKHKKFQGNNEVLTELYISAKKQQQNCYIFGEHPFDPSEIIPFKHLDGITNYAGFYNPIRYWLNDSIDFTVMDFDHALREFRISMGYQFTLSSKTFLGNHDKPRLFTELGGDINKYLTALTFLFTYPGVPTLYYGEEIALSDSSIENDSRMCMKWQNWSKTNQAIFKYTKQLIQLYKSNIAIQKGDFKTLYCQNEIMVYARVYKSNLVIIVLSQNTIKNKDPISIDLDLIGKYVTKIFSTFPDNVFVVGSTNQLIIKHDGLNLPLLLTLKQ